MSHDVVVVVCRAVVVMNVERYGGKISSLGADQDICSHPGTLSDDICVVV